jgi:hypothetical protein
MLRLKFNQVFIGLMALSFISAFLAPPHLADAGRVEFERLFIPVSRPTYIAANWLRRRLAPDPPDDNRSYQTIAQENLLLRQQVARLQLQNERLEGLAAERENLGDLKSLCDRLPVGGTDSGGREGLILGAAPRGPLQADEPVVYGGGLAGKIDRAGAGAAHVRLLTDSGFPALTGRFIRFVKSDSGIEAQSIYPSPVIVQGAGGGTMTITNLPFADVNNLGLKPDDWVILADNNWPAAIQGIRLGKVSSISHWRRQPLFAEIRLQPQTSLTRLADVWVMTRQTQ